MIVAVCIHIEAELVDSVEYVVLVARRCNTDEPTTGKGWEAFQQMLRPPNTVGKVPRLPVPDAANELGPVVKVDVDLSGCWHCVGHTQHVEIASYSIGVTIYRLFLRELTVDTSLLVGQQLRLSNPSAETVES